MPKENAVTFIKENPRLANLTYHLESAQASSSLRLQGQQRKTPVQGFTRQSEQLLHSSVFQGWRQSETESPYLLSVF